MFGTNKNTGGKALTWFLDHVFCANQMTTTMIEDSFHYYSGRLGVALHINLRHTEIYGLPNIS